MYCLMMQSRPIYGMEMGDNYLCTQYIAKKTLFLQKKKCLHVIIHSKLKLYCKEFCFCFFFYISSTAKYISIFCILFIKKRKIIPNLVLPIKLFERITPKVAGISYFTFLLFGYSCIHICIASGPAHLLELLLSKN